MLTKTVYVIAMNGMYWSDYGDGWIGDRSNAREWREKLSAESFAKNLAGNPEVKETQYPVYPGREYLENWYHDNRTIQNVVGAAGSLLLGKISPEDFEEMIERESRKLAYYK